MKARLGRAGPAWRVALGVLVVAMCAWQGDAMAKMVIFSAVQGQVLLNGAPVAGAEIVREFHWAWKSEDGGDKTGTGKDGGFVLPTIERSSFLGSLLPHEAVIKQRILVRHAGKSYDLWLNFKRDYDNNSENGGRPIKVVCRLEGEPVRRGQIMGLCEFV